MGQTVKNETASPGESLWTRDFVGICSSYFMMSMAFYMLMPVFPLYLLNELGAAASQTGIILSGVSIGALIIRPVSGYTVDSFTRKKLLCLCSLIFSFLFPLYWMLTNLVCIGVLRFAHGIAFGMMSTAASTVAVDIMPLKKLGSGIGIYGVMFSLAMALGPMLGMLVLENCSYTAVFVMSFVTALLGYACVLPVRHSVVLPPRKPFSLRFESFFLKKATHVFIALTLCGSYWGMLVNYLSVFAPMQGITLNVGWYFCIVAVGMLFSRIAAGRIIDSGRMVELIIFGTLMTLIATLVFECTANTFLSVTSSVFIGIGYGLLTPAYQAVFIAFAGIEDRGKANSTCFIAWDLSIGGAVFFGGMLSDVITLQGAYLASSFLMLLSLVWLLVFTIPSMKRAGIH